jgi:hypothetical protein
LANLLSNDKVHTPCLEFNDSRGRGVHFVNRVHIQDDSSPFLVIRSVTRNYRQKRAW